MISFANLHKTKSHAYVDGFLCGILITYIGVKIYQDWKESRELERLAKEDDKIENQPK